MAIRVWKSEFIVEGAGFLVFKAHRLLYHSTLGLRVIKKKTKVFCFYSHALEPMLLHSVA